MGFCEHKTTFIETSGSIYFQGGDVVNTLEDRVICLDCLEEVQPGSVPDDEEEEIPF